MTASYIRIKATLHSLTRDAAQVTEQGKGSFTAPVWIPRSLIHGGDDLALAKAMRDDTVTFRLMDWKARELGLGPVAKRAGQQEMNL